MAILDAQRIKRLGWPSKKKRQETVLFIFGGRSMIGDPTNVIDRKLRGLKVMERGLDKGRVGKRRLTDSQIKSREKRLRKRKKSLGLRP